MAWQETPWSDGLLCSDLIICKWFFSCLEGGGGLRWGNLDFWRNVTYGTSAPPAGWCIGQTWGGSWDLTGLIPSKGLFKWRPPPNGESRSGKYLKKTVKGIFSPMCLVGCWKISSTFFLTYSVLKFFDIWNWQSNLINGYAEAFIEPILLTC